MNAVLQPRVDIRPMSPDDLDLDLTTQALAKVNAAKKAKAA